MSANDDFLHKLVQANTLEGINELMTGSGDGDQRFDINRALYSDDEASRELVEQVQSQIFTELSAAEGRQKATLLYNLGCFSLHQDDIQDAILRFSETLSEEPKNMMAQHNLAYAYELSAEYEKAGDEYEKVMAQNPNSNISRLNLALMRIQARDFNGGLEELQELHSEEPNNIGVILYLCRGLIARGAEGDLEEVLEILEHQPDKDKFLDLKECRAFALFQIGRIDEAETAFTSLLEENEQNQFARMGLMKVAALNSDFNGLKEHAMIYQALDPSDDLEKLLEDL